MTLEVRIDILPKGDRSLRRPVYTVRVSQIDEQDRKHDFRDYDYEILEHNDMIPKGQAGHVIVVGRGRVYRHKRGDRALELVRRVLENHVLGD